MFSRLNNHAFSVYRRLLAYVQPHRKIIAVTFVAVLIQAGTDASIPLIMEQVMARLGGATETAAWAEHIPILIVIVIALRGAMDFVAVYGLTWVGRSVIRDLRAELFEKYLALPARFFDTSSSGVLLSKLTYNTEQVAEAISNAVVVVIRDSLRIIVLLGVMIYLSAQLMILVAVVAPVVALLVRQMSRAFRRYSARIQSSMGDVTRIAEQSLQGHRVVKIFEGHEQEAENFNATNRWNFRLNVRLAAVRVAGDSVTQFAVALGVAAIIFVAFSDWLLEALSPELFIAFITAMGMLLAPLKRLININVALQRGVAAAESVFEILDEPGENDSGTLSIERATGNVVYRQVSFGYAPENGRVLHDIDFVVEAGSTVAFVGRSGSGKSSLVSLLPRFYDIDSGEITLDGTDVREYRLKELRRQISLVSQDVVLFDDTIANNIAYGGLTGKSRAEIERAADAAFVTEFADEFPDGLDTSVGERGALLSGGQRQRIAIARALLKDAPILILDEATSALDTESERRIQRALEHLMAGRTTLIIAHRLSTIESADRIVVLDDGAIVESGTHAELLERGGFYAALYRMQFAAD